MSKDSVLVFSTDPDQQIPANGPKIQIPQGDGIVRIRRETKGRKGKGMTLIDGLAMPEKELKVLAKELKKRTGVGGAVKNFVIELQGDQREIAKAYLEGKGHKVKLAGG